MCAETAGPKKPLSDTVRQLGALSTVGFSFVLAVVLGAGLGWLIDRWIGTSPWGFLVFFVFGLVAGGLNVYRTAGKFLKQMERDATLRGVERNSLLIGAAITVAACFVRPWPDIALGAIGGGVLAGFSYWSLKKGVSGLVEVMIPRGAEVPPARVNMPRELAKLTLRYALLALLAYVMIARLRLHPWGLLAGASSVVAGVSLQAVLLLAKK